MFKRISLTRRRLFYASVALLIIFSPALVGALRPSLFWPLYSCAFVIALCSLAFDSPRAKRAVLVLASVSLTITVADLALRFTPVVPDDLVERWPRMPLVSRYRPGLNYEGKRFNDLSRMAGVKQWREEKTVRIVTDSEGFRNERQDLSRPLDVIILGDSFGAGAVSQEYTLTAVLTRDHRLNTYNLSAPAIGPWGEYVNLWAEGDRLKTRDGTTLVWLIFAGNGLDDEYGPLDMSSLPWCGSARAWLNRFNGWRERSPVRYLFENLRPAHDPRADVVAHDFLNGRKLLFYRPYIKTSLRTPDEVVAHANFPRLRETVSAMKRLADGRGMRVLVALVPTKEEVYSWEWKGEPPWSSNAGPSGFSVMLSRVCAEEGMRFLDLKPELIEESRSAYEGSGRLLYWYDDTHLDTEGSVFTASIIYRELAH
jgi:hypothetical protein